MRTEDLDEVIAIDRDASETAAPRRMFQNFTSKEGFFAEVAREGGEVLGYVLYELLDGGVFIPRVAVRKSDQRKGVGRALVGSVVKRARKHGVEAVAALVSSDRHDAQLFFRELGFIADVVVPDQGRFLMARRFQLPEATLEELGLEKYAKKEIA